MVVDLQGQINFNIVGDTITVNAERITNTSTTAITGTLRLELWALNSPYSGSGGINGFKLAQSQLDGGQNGQLGPGQFFFDIQFTDSLINTPPNGSYSVVLFVTEFTNDPINGGFSIADFGNFNGELVFGPTSNPGGTFTPNPFVGDGGPDIINGNNQANEIEGRGGNDVLRGFGGNDTLIGSSGNDTLNGGTGRDILNGGNGFDRAIYTNAAQAVRADLLFPNTNKGEAAGDRYFSVEFLSGSRFGDVLAGNAAPNILSGLGGNDFLLGRSNDDLLYGHTGNDRLNGGTGADRLFGGAGTDRAEYNFASASVRADLQLPTQNLGEATGDTYASIENLLGSRFNDTLRGNSESNGIWGGNGGDVITGRNGADRLFGQNGNDRLNGGTGPDRLDGGAGIDRAEYGSAAGGLRADLQLPNLNSNDALGDRFFSIENLSGSNFNDTLGGNGGNNSIWGRSGNDVIQGRGGNDRLYGEGGNDRLNGGPGADLLAGGAGIDRAEYTNAASRVRADLKAPGTNNGEATGDTYFSIENLFGSRFNDLLAGDDSGNSLSGFGGNDRLLGRDGADMLIGQQGDDTLEGGNGSDTLLGGAGEDLLRGGSNFDSLTGGGGADVFEFNEFSSINDITDFGAGDLILITGGASSLADLTISSYVTTDTRILFDNVDNTDIVLRGVDFAAFDTGTILFV